MGIQNPPLSAPVVDPSEGKMTQIWVGFLRTLISSATSPVVGPGSIGTTQLADLSVTLAKLASEIIQVSGSRASPLNITAAGGIAPAGKWFEVMWITGSAGPVTLTANPQIVPGTAGQILILIGGPNAVTIANGNGTRQNGPMTIDQDDVLAYLADASSAWTELFRKDAA